MLLDDLWELRKSLDESFSVDTAYRGTKWDHTRPSMGHCGVVAYLVWAKFGGQMVSAKVDEQSHWFNRIGGVDVDLTADQFYLAPMLVADNGRLPYKEQKLRKFDDLKQETINRAQTLIKRAGLNVADFAPRRPEGAETRG